MKHAIACFLAVMLLVAVFGAATADDGEDSRGTLRGLRGVNVLVEQFSESAKRAGFDQQPFRTDAEIRLRMAGISALTQEEMFATPGMPTLYMRVTPLHKTPGQINAFAITLELQQDVLLFRDTTMRADATTWSVGRVGLGNLPSIRGAVKDQVDRFINAWLSVNPKTP